MQVVVGLQMLIVFFVALGVRANLPLIVALQWISNPFTVAPIYFADYEIGLSLLGLLAIDYPRNEILTAEYDWSNFELTSMGTLLDTFPPMFLGGSVLGIALGVLSVFLYKGLVNLYKSPTTQSQ